MSPSRFSLITAVIAALVPLSSIEVRAATVSCPILTQGSMHQINGSSHSKGTANRWFGIDDGATGNTLHRAYVWWNLSSIPGGVAIDDAKVSIGYNLISFEPSSRRVQVGIVGNDYAGWNALSLSSQFTQLGQANTHWIDETFPDFQPGLGLTRSFRPFMDLLWILNQSTVGMAFRTDESDTAFVDDTTILDATASNISITYYGAPSLSSPPNTAEITDETPVVLQWASVLPLGSNLRYQVQFSDHSDFSSNTAVNHTSATSWNVATFEAGLRIYWRVRVEDPNSAYAANYSDWSPSRYFDVIKSTCAILPGGTGGGTGTITYNPGGTACGGGQMQCFDCGTTVSLTAVPAVGSVFERWYVNNQDAGTQNPIQVTADNQNYTAVTAKFVLLPAAPFGDSASDLTSNSFVAHWRSVSGVNGYRLDVSTSRFFNSFVPGFQNLDVGNVLQKQVIGLNPETTYYYRLRSYNDAGTSANSNYQQATTYSVAPPLLRGNLGGGTFILTWPDDGNVFTPEYKTDLNSPDWTTISTTPTIQNGNYILSQPLTGGTRIFRLKK